MSADTIFLLAIGVYAITAVGILSVLWTSRQADRDDLADFQRRCQEQDAERQLRPRTGLVTASTRRAPFDPEAELRRATDFMMALHKIDRALPDEEWDHLLGDGRN